MLFTFPSPNSVVIMFIGSGTSSQHIGNLSENVALAEEMHNGIFELNILTYDYLTHQEERAKIQWYLKYDSITKLLDENDFEDEDKYLILAQIRKNHAEIKPIFLQLVEIHEKQDANGYELATTNHYITWTPNDLNPDNYVIYQDGSNVETGQWISDSPIIINIDSLTLGAYNFTLVVYDSFGNCLGLFLSRCPLY